MTLAAIKPEPRDLPLGLLNPPELAARVGMDEIKLEELAGSIRQHGVIQRLIVAPDGERFEIVAGHRRYMAATRAGLVFVPCDVYPSKTSALEAVKYAENRFREEMSAAEEAIYFSELLERDCGGDVDVLCHQLGEKRTYVENRLLLFSGDRAVFDALQARKIVIGVAQELNKCPVEQYRRYLLHQAIAGGATVTVVRGWLQDYQNQQRLLEGSPAPALAPSAPAAIPQTDYFRCACCLGTENVHLMVPINVHQHCKLAILDKLLDAYHGS